jgi:hypothetical protein
VRTVAGRGDNFEALTTAEFSIMRVFVARSIREIAHWPSPRPAGGNRWLLLLCYINFCTSLQ